MGNYSCRRSDFSFEEAFNTTKRFLNLSYLWTGSLNGIQLQIWATWLFYALLVDLGDALADRMGVPLIASLWRCPAWPVSFLASLQPRLGFRPGFILC